MLKNLYTLTILLLVTAATAHSQDLVILHTNDTHSQIVPQITGKGKGLGGYERRETYINSIRKEHKNVLLVDAGDFSQGTPYFTIFNGDVEIELMNALRYDVACLGNHEFDNGQKELARRIQDAKFPIVCANFSFSDESPLNKVVKPYITLKKGGYKIGVIGILINLPGLVSPKNIEGMKHQHPYAVVNKLALELKNKEKCDLIILLTHVGYERGKEQSPSDDMLAANSENVDIVIGGHSHTHITKPAFIKNKLGKEVMVVTAGEKGEDVGRIDIHFGGK